MKKEDFEDICFLLDLRANYNQSDEQTMMEADELPQSQTAYSVPHRFPSIELYQEVWSRLFRFEAMAQIRKTIAQNYGPDFFNADLKKKSQMVNVTAFSQINSTTKLLHFKRTTTITRYGFGALVMLEPMPSQQPHRPHLVGFVESTSDAQLEISVKVRLSVTLEQTNPELWKLFVSAKEWSICFLSNTSTLQREFSALNRFRQIDSVLQEVILRPDLHTSEVSRRFQIPTPLQACLNQVYNESQLTAIYECLKQSGITLVQGPPGTGKTKTVLGTVSVLLSSEKGAADQDDTPLVLSWKKTAQLQEERKRFAPWLRKGFVDWRDQPYMTNENDQIGLTKIYIKSEATDRKIAVYSQDETIQLPGRVLICGPSNASVDQIIRKLIVEELHDKNGHKYLPKFVRVGENYDSTLEEFALDNQALRLAKATKSNDINFFKQKVLSEAKIVFSTISAAGSAAMAGDREEGQNSTGLIFDTVVIDEAGQSIQISNIIPLLFGCKRLILIGDPNQLPATVFSAKCITEKYSQSLFERMMASKYPVTVLRTQYRMHPQISHVVGKYFYNNLLLDSQSVQVTVQTKRSLPAAFIMVHLDKSSESSFSNSYRNTVEAHCIKRLAAFIARSFNGDVGVVSPYSAQVDYMNSIGLNKACEVKTIDSFQGRQKSVIILSTVRSRYFGKNFKPNKKRTIGFVSDLRRINVSLSRAKEACVIVGDLKKLKVDAVWSKIICEAIEKGQVFNLGQEDDELWSRDRWDAIRVKEL